MSEPAMALLGDALGTPRCGGTNSSGEPCQVPADLLHQDEAGAWWCNSHSPNPLVQQARHLARQRGGQTAGQRGKKLLDPDELGALNSEEACHSASVVIAQALATGRITPARANGLRSLVALALSALKQVGERDALNRVVADLKAKIGSGDHATISHLKRILGSRRRP